MSSKTGESPLANEAKQQISAPIRKGCEGNKAKHSRHLVHAMSVLTSLYVSMFILIFYVHFHIYGHGHVRAPCSCKMFMQHGISTWTMDMQRVHATFSYSIFVQHIHAA
jgi:hypothetical protein